MPGISDLSSSATKASGSALPWGAIAQGAVGLGQTIAGMIQRSKGLKEAKQAIKGLGPNQGILDYYNQALSKYSGLRAGESLTQKQFAQQARQNLAGALQSYRQAGDIQAGGAAALRAANEAALKSAALGYQEQGQALSRLGSAAQMKAAEELRPKELEFQLAAQRAAGGSQLANTGMSNIFGAAQGYGTQQLYKDIYGTPKEYGSSTPVNWRVSGSPIQGLSSTAMGVKDMGVVPVSGVTSALRKFTPGVRDLGIMPRVSILPTGIRRG